jgi:hypothetical protein
MLINILDQERIVHVYHGKDSLFLLRLPTDYEQARFIEALPDSLLVGWEDDGGIQIYRLSSDGALLQSARITLDNRYHYHGGRTLSMLDGNMLHLWPKEAGVHLVLDTDLKVQQQRTVDWPGPLVGFHHRFYLSKWQQAQQRNDPAWFAIFCEGMAGQPVAANMIDLVSIGGTPHALYHFTTLGAYDKSRGDCTRMYSSLLIKLDDGSARMVDKQVMGVMLDNIMVRRGDRHTLEPQ